MKVCNNRNRAFSSSVSCEVRSHLSLRALPKLGASGSVFVQKGKQKRRKNFELLFGELYFFAFLLSCRFYFPYLLSNPCQFSQNLWYNSSHKKYATASFHIVPVNHEQACNWPCRAVTGCQLPASDKAARKKTKAETCKGERMSQLEQPKTSRHPMSDAGLKLVRHQYFQLIPYQVLLRG